MSTMSNSSDVRMDPEYKSTFSCFTSVGACFVLSVIYVSSLYVWNSPHNRDHPSTIKRRFFSVFVMMFVSPLFLYLFASERLLRSASLCELLGLRWKGIIPATVLPLVLTMLLFLGPISMEGFRGLWKLYSEPMYWLSNARNLIWLRNHVVAPLSEEFTFRACMMPLLLECVKPFTAVFICPLFFGVGHFHHIAERLRNGMDFKTTIQISCFQFLYTTIFGAYAAYLFARTGHFIAPFTAHAFCNHMGFPDFSEVAAYQEPQKSIVLAMFVLGLLLWCLLLSPLTTPSWYGNSLYWQNS